MKIVEKEGLLVIGLPVRAAWRELRTQMPKAWRELFARASEIEHHKADFFMDVALGVENGKYLQLVGAEVAQVGRVPDGMIAVNIPTQQYIQYQHLGHLAGIADSFGEIYDWAKEQGYATAEFKLDIGYTAAGNEALHDLYVATHPSKEWKLIKAP